MKYTTVSTLEVSILAFVNNLKYPYIVYLFVHALFLSFIELWKYLQRLSTDWSMGLL